MTATLGTGTTDARSIVETLGYRPFDADNHYYEATDCVTRHLDPRHATRLFQWSQIDGRSYPVLGGTVFRGVKNATFDPVAFPGVLADYFRGNPNGDDPLELLSRHEPIRPEYRDRDARLATMDDHGLDSVWLFPTLGMIYEEPLKHDPEAVTLLFTAFNDWPHIEALPEPLQYAAEVTHLSKGDQRKILKDNVIELNARRPD
ncbi:MAG: hypothetical protein OSA99_13545 [Acidimicrobiales bacterium]|nr:hypothetical protein [Acidimicrobiales bacterium]